MDAVMPSSVPIEEEADDLGVTIEAKYTVGEYDILILSAEESDGLIVWLNENGYKIPLKATEVLEPYIRSDMKFFLVKVDLENTPQSQLNGLVDHIINVAFFLDFVRVFIISAEHQVV